MFDYDCPSCGKHQLIFPSQIERLVNDDEGIALIFACWCGALGAFRTGSAAARPTAGPAPHTLAS